MSKRECLDISGLIPRRRVILTKTRTGPALPDWIRRDYSARRDYRAGKIRNMIQLTYHSQNQIDYIITESIQGESVHHDTAPAPKFFGLLYLLILFYLLMSM